MGKRTKPRAGSLQFKPRKRAKKETPRIRKWQKTNEVKPLGFAGYKAGMTHAMLKDNRKRSTTSGLNVFSAVTVLETPPMLIAGIRVYYNGYNGKETLTDVFAFHDSKKISNEKIEKKLKDIENSIDKISDISLIAYTQPKLTGIGKKKPDIMEIAIGGNTKEKFNYAKEKLGKEISIREIFNEKSFVDVTAVTKGKGFQGVVKRHGTIILPRKSGKGIRHLGTGGAWTPHRKLWREPLPGKLGYHTRTEYNKLLLKIGDKPEEVNPKGGFIRYGILRNDYVVLKGSVPGPTKRVVRLTFPRRSHEKEYANFDILEINLDSKH